MPLNDVLEQQNFGRLKRLGIIRLGWQEPNQSGQGQHPVASDHFVLKDAPYLAQFFGDEPRSLPIYFPYTDFDRNINATYGVWAGGQSRGKGICVCRGDGKKVLSALPFTAGVRDDGTVTVRRAPGERLVSWGKAAMDFGWDDYAFKEDEVVPCPGRSRDKYTHCGACSPNILISIVIRDPRAALFGYWQISTSSIANYTHLLSVWDRITGGGRVPIPMDEVPLVLSIAPGSTLFQDQRSKMWGSRDAFFLNLELDPEIAQLEMDYRNRRFVELLQGGNRPEIPQLVEVAGEEDEMPPWFEDDEPEVVEPEVVEPEPQKPEPRSWSGAAVKAIIEAKLAENARNAVGMLNLSQVLQADDEQDRIVLWATTYRAARDYGKASGEAAAEADKVIRG